MAGLAIVAAVIVGVLPGLKATGRRVHAGLQQLSTHGSQMQLGRTWTALIVLQVAVAAAILPYTVYVAAESFRQGTAEPGYRAEEFLRGWLSMERVETPPDAEAEAYERAFEADFRDRAAELVRRLEAEPAVAGVTFASARDPRPGAAGAGRGADGGAQGGVGETISSSSPQTARPSR